MFPDCNSTTSVAIQATDLSKCYPLYHHPRDRLKQFLWPSRWWGEHKFYRELWALRQVNFSINRGEVVGIVGQNGSGKSTLLQLICGTLTPTHGHVNCEGRIAALLELGAGFNPEFTGRENVLMNAAILGLRQQEIDQRLENIIDFSGVRDFIDQPVKTYSSGMYVRLAFSVAINIDPDILVIDEALSVGDGAFARKSFNRIMQMRDSGKTILFCSHSLFQVESLCARAIWIHQGQIVMDADSPKVVSAYQAFLDQNSSESPPMDTLTTGIAEKPPEMGSTITSGYARFDKIAVFADNIPMQNAIVASEQSNLRVELDFTSDPMLPCPTIGVTIQSKDGRTITSAATWEDTFTVQRSASGSGQICIEFRHIPLLKGEYQINTYLLCERGLHIYDTAENIASMEVQQTGRLQGYFSIPHEWKNT